MVFKLRLALAKAGLRVRGIWSRGREREHAEQVQDSNVRNDCCLTGAAKDIATKIMMSDWETASGLMIQWFFAAGISRFGNFSKAWTTGFCEQADDICGIFLSPHFVVSGIFFAS